MHKVKIGRKKFDVPENWGEVSDKQARHLLPLYFSDPNPKFRRAAALGVFIPKPKLLRRLSDVQMAELYGLLTFINEVPTACIFENFEFDGKQYAAPPPDFVDFTGGEFIKALSFFETEDITSLAALLFRHPNMKHETEDRREAFKEYKFQKRKKAFEKLPPVRALAALLWFVANKKKLYEQHPRSFAGGGEKQKGGRSVLQSWVNTFVSLAGQNVFGSLAEVEKSPIRDLCYYMEKLKIEEFERKANQY